MKKNILIISIYYPPMQSIASNRIYSFAKYLNRDKYNIFVHTLEESKQDKDQKNHLNLTDVFVSRVENNIFFQPFSFFQRTNRIIHYFKVIYNIVIKKLTTNIYQDWIDKSYEYLKGKIEDEHIELMLSSFAPDASHLLALKLKKEFPHLHWIADMRDEMSCSPYINTKMSIRYQKLEQDIFQYANAVTSISKPILNQFKSMNKNEKILFCEIRNGYDFLLEERVVDNDIFTLTYTGNFYGDINPINFFKALELFVSKNLDLQLKVQLVGVKTHFDIPLLLIGMIEIFSTVTHAEAIAFMRESDALLLIYPSNGRKGVFTGKLFEYLGVLRPILALIDEEDVASSLIEKSNAGYIADNSNIEKIEENIAKIYSDYKKKKKRVFNIELIQQHHRKEQTKRLEKLMENLDNAE